MPALPPVRMTRRWRGLRRLQELFWSSKIVPRTGGLAVDDHAVIADEIGAAVDEFKGHAATAFEEITATTWVRKRFLVEGAPLAEAKLCISGERLRGEGELAGTFNSTPFAHSHKPNSGWYSDWVIVPLPAPLRRGINELVLHATGSLVYRLFIEPSVSPNRSARSIDAGRSWDDAHLGSGGFLDGEYVLRISGSQRDARGTLTSPPIQIRPAGDAVALAGRVLAVEVKADCPAAADVRIGNGPWLDRPGVWSAWGRPTAAGVAAMERSLRAAGPRFVQFRLAVRRTAAGSPVLRQVALSAALRPAFAPPPVRVRIDGPPTVLPGEPFTHQRPHERLAKLRRHFKLDAVFARGRDEWEGLLHVAAWVGQHCCWYGDTPFGMTGLYDLVRILHEGHRREARVMCGHLAFALVQLAAAMGYTGRVILRGNHLVTEMFSPVHRKWAVLDQQDQVRDPATGRMKWTGGFGGYYHLGDNVPLSAAELGAARGKVLRRHLVYPAARFRSRQATVERDLRWFRREISYPLRNNHTDAYEPQFFADVFHYAGHLKYRRRARPVMPYYWRYTARPGDIEWTVEETSAFLTAVAPGELCLQFRSQMPNTTAYQLDGERITGDEHRRPLTGRSQQGFTVAAVNAFGRAGPATVCQALSTTDLG